MSDGDETKGKKQAAMVAASSKKKESKEESAGGAKQRGKKSSKTTKTEEEEEEDATVEKGDEEEEEDNVEDGKKKKKVERLPRPSREKHEQAMKKLNDQIEARKSIIESAKTKIKALREKREKEQAKYAPIRSKLNELAAQCQILMQTRDACRKEVQALDNMGKGDGSNSGRGKSAEQIDAEVARIEDQISHETMSLKEEKVLVEKIKQLNKMKDAAKAMAAKQAQITGTDGSRKAMQEKERRRTRRSTPTKQSSKN